MKTIFSILLITSIVYPQVNFDEYFNDKALRMDYFHTGNSTEDIYSFDELIEEQFWGLAAVGAAQRLDEGFQRAHIGQVDR